MLRKISVNGITVKTNMGESGDSALCNGCDRDGYEMRFKPMRLPKEKFIEQLVSEGYNYILFKEIATTIKGYHDVVAYCKTVKL